MIEHMSDVKRFFKERQKLGIQLGMDRTQKFLQALGNPEKDLQAIHVAGTNGKGSTIHFVSQALVANGYEVGVFSSPSLTGLTGHIHFNGEKISDHQFLSLFQEIYPVIQTLDSQGVYVTTFEIITVIAFLYFSRHADLALIETGMGGRDDTTNCFEPILSVITNIDNDHTDYLGQTIEEIAEHKVGIIKNNVPVILGDIHPAVWPVVDRAAKHKQASTYQLDDDFNYQIIKQEQGQLFHWTYKQQTEKIHISMLGEHQVKNCSIALMILACLEGKNIALQRAKTKKGLFSAQLPGRFEVIQRKNKQVILDGAHNQAGIQSFLHTAEEFSRNISEKHLVFSAFRDKDVEEMLKMLKPYFSSLTLTTFKHQRALTHKEITALQQKHPELIITQDWEKIVSGLHGDHSSGQAAYFFLGSLYFVAKVRAQLKGFSWLE